MGQKVILIFPCFFGDKLARSLRSEFLSKSSRSCDHLAVMHVYSQKEMGHFL